MLMSYLPQTGMMRSRKYFRLEKSASSSTLRFISNSSLMCCMRSGSQPGMMVAVGVAGDGGKHFLRIQLIHGLLGVGEHGGASGRTRASSVLVQSNTGMKL